MLKKSSGDPSINMLVAEIALDKVQVNALVSTVTHVPSVADVWPDALSRPCAPGPKPFPAEWARVVRIQVRRRTLECWEDWDLVWVC